MTALERLPRNLDKLNSGRVDISATRITDLSGLASKPNLVSLVLNDRISTLDDVGALPDLEELVAYRAPLRDIAALRRCTSLKVAQLNVADVADLSPLADLPNLERLELWSYRGQTLWPDATVRHFNIIHASARSADLTPLTTWPNLGLLSCDGRAIAGAMPVLAAVQFLSIPGCDDDIFAALAGYQALQQLFAYDGPLSDLGPLAPCAELESVTVSHTSVSSIDALLDKMALRDLAIEGTKVDQVSALSWLPRLRYLRADRTPVRDLSGWNPNSAVRSLSIGDTEVSDLSMLEGRELGLLNLARTRVSDLGFIAALPSLTGLNFSGTEVSDFAPVLAKPALLTDTSNMDPRDASAYFLDFSDTPLTRSDPVLHAIAQIEDRHLRQKALRERFLPAVG